MPPLPSSLRSTRMNPIPSPPPHLHVKLVIHIPSPSSASASYESYPPLLRVLSPVPFPPPPLSCSLDGPFRTLGESPPRPRQVLWEDTLRGIDARLSRPHLTTPYKCALTTSPSITPFSLAQVRKSSLFDTARSFALIPLATNPPSYQDPSPSLPPVPLPPRFPLSHIPSSFLLQLHNSSPPHPHPSPSHPHPSPSPPLPSLFLAKVNNPHPPPRQWTGGQLSLVPNRV